MLRVWLWSSGIARRRVRCLRIHSRFSPCGEEHIRRSYPRCRAPLFQLPDQSTALFTFVVNTPYVDPLLQLPPACTVPCFFFQTIYKHTLSILPVLAFVPLFAAVQCVCTSQSLHHIHHRPFMVCQFSQLSPGNGYATGLYA